MKNNRTGGGAAAAVQSASCGWFSCFLQLAPTLLLVPIPLTDLHHLHPLHTLPNAPESATNIAVAPTARSVWALELANMATGATTAKPVCRVETDNAVIATASILNSLLKNLKRNDSKLKMARHKNEHWWWRSVKLSNESFSFHWWYTQSINLNLHVHTRKTEQPACSRSCRSSR